MYYLASALVDWIMAYYALTNPKTDNFDDKVEAWIMVVLGVCDFATACFHFGMFTEKNLFDFEKPLNDDLKKELVHWSHRFFSFEGYIVEYSVACVCLIC